MRNKVLKERKKKLDDLKEKVKLYKNSLNNVDNCISHYKSKISSSDFSETDIVLQIKLLNKSRDNIIQRLNSLQEEIEEIDL